MPQRWPPVAARNAKRFPVGRSHPLPPCQVTDYFAELMTQGNTEAAHRILAPRVEHRDMVRGGGGWCACGQRRSLPHPQQSARSQVLVSTCLLLPRLTQPLPCFPRPLQVRNEGRYGIAVRGCWWLLSLLAWPCPAASALPRLQHLPRLARLRHRGGGRVQRVAGAAAQAVGGACSAR